jgi:hypothetical protein
MNFCRICGEVLEMEKLREAVIHFELYRLLKNCLVLEGYFDVEPEKSGADLVLTRKVDGQDKNLMVIEVKSARNRFSAYDSKAKEQAKTYADRLDADYCAVTNGHIIWLFKRPHKDYGHYRFELNEECVKRFLNDLFEMINGEREGLSLPKAPSIEEIARSTNNFAETIRKVLETLNGQHNFRLEIEDKGKTHMFYLSVGKFKRLLRLGIPHTQTIENKPFVDIRINALKRRLGVENVKKMLNELSKIPGFEWVKNYNIKREFIWKYLTPPEQANMRKLEQELTSWLLKLSTPSN